MPDPQPYRPKLQWYDLKTGERARKGVTGAVYAAIEGGGRYERRGEAPNFTAVFIDADGTETVLPREGSPDLAQNVSVHAAYRAHISHYYGLGEGDELGDAGSGSDVADVEDELEMITRPLKSPTGVGPRLSAAERRVIEQHAVSVVTTHLTSMGYTVEYVGDHESYDLHAARDDHAVLVEVKGTTSEGSAIVLTRNEVELHKSAHPNNGLAVVRRVRLSRNDAGPTASGGDLVLRMPWVIDEDRLSPIAYQYDTGPQV